MGKLTKDELQVRNREIQDRMSELNETVVKEKRENFNEEEQREWNNLSREYELNEMKMQSMMTDEELAKHREIVSKGEQLREYLKQVRQGKADREILLFPADGNVSANVTASGAIQLSIHEMIPTLHEGLDLPASLRIVTGVTGNEIWPVSINDAEMEEVGEVEALNDQVLDFANITPTQRRVGLTIPVSNMAIDNAAFDLLAFVQAKFTIALRIYLAKKLYSLAQWTGNKGPFSGLTKAGDIEIGADSYKNILKAVAKFSDKGFFEGDVVIIMDRETEAELKATPLIAGAAGGFVVQNGRCAGYPYVVTHYLNTELNSAGSLVPTAKKYIAFGYFEWFALQQHGTVRMTTDATSTAVAKKNLTQITLNTAWSFTDLSKKINGANDVTQAFAIYEVVEEEPTTV
ncbi:MAG: phage major capsid protein [Bacteroidales bacterium]|nr:phage major capsid protein [Bacteroidaceae bacterium]MBO5707668.1 phage major capsid protein [Bacteroidaceae bacterium]MBO7528277.1 phage major capsid protein [Bacteroidales bacterium]MBO7528538.1 phage major capsid protein [Bacteroidales bacterium]